MQSWSSALIGMRPQLRKILYRALILWGLAGLFLLILQSSQAQEPSGGGGALILPFKIESSLAATKTFLFSEDPALGLQKASHFLVERHYEYPLVPIPETRAILDELEFRAQSLLDSRRALQICRRSDADHLLTGNSYALSKRKLFLQVLSFSCRTQQILKSPKIKVNSRIEIQSKLRRLLKNVLPFARSASLSLSSSAPSQRAIDLAAILDFSGSMRQDMPEILRQLGYMKRNRRAESRLGAVVMEDQNQVRALQMNRNWDLNLKILKAKEKRGEVTFATLLKALGAVERYEDWENKAMLLFFTDLSLSSRLASRLSLRLQSLRNRALQFCFFPLARQSRSTQASWHKLAQSLEAQYMSDLIYARSAFLAGQGRVFFITKKIPGFHFFFTKKDLRSQIPSNTMNWEKLRPIVASNFLEEDLNLDRIPYVYAQSQRDKVLSLGPYISNIGKSIANCLNTEGAGARRIRRILVKNMNHAFWINIDREVFPLLVKDSDKIMHLGLHWERGKESKSLVNLPAPVYVRTRAQVPKIFLWEWKALQKAVSLNIPREDIYFLKLKIIDLKSERERHEIR